MSTSSVSPSCCHPTVRVPSTRRTRVREGHLPYARHSSRSLMPAESTAQLPVCTLPLDQCRIPVEVCDSDCWTSNTTPVCTSTEHCVVVPCSEPLATDCAGPCDTSCDQWMDWLACDGITCYAPPSQDGCLQCAPALTLSASPEAQMASTLAPTSSSLHVPQAHPQLQQHHNPLQPHHIPNYEWRAGADQNAWSHQSSHLGSLSHAAGPSRPTHRIPYPSPALHAQNPSSHYHPVFDPPGERIVCLWGACRDTFASQADLVAHVNFAHLGVDPSPITPTSNVRDRDALACHWADCGIQLTTPQRYPTESEGENLSLLASHLLQDHLGLRPSTDLELLLASLAPSTELTSADATCEVAANTPLGGLSSSSSQVTLVPQHTGASHASATSEISHVSSTQYRKPITAPNHPSSFTSQKTSRGASSSRSSLGAADLPSLHLCRWSNCGKTSENIDVLSAHILDEHVGSGKREYHCLWEGCDRSGAKAFTSKQKILRHLQAHTGYKPFECKECGQHFSEAATLQQHIRRHTFEKPFACDFPGCEKTFAVAGALTIHKRIHTGSKPFKCTYCDKAFAESSNLAKHTRTHTGDKPYICPESGCHKRFCRPDQLNRHRIVHMKKDGVQNVDTPEDSDADVSMSAE